MANEITITTGIKLANGLLEVPNTQKTRQFNQTTARGGGPGVLDIGTSEESVSFGDTVPGWVELVNLDSTNYVEYYGNTGGNFGRLPPNGGCALIYMNTSATLYLKANTAGCKVRVTALNT